MHSVGLDVSRSSKIGFAVVMCSATQLKYGKCGKKQSVRNEGEPGKTGKNRPEERRELLRREIQTRAHSNTNL